MAGPAFVTGQTNSGTSATSSVSVLLTGVTAGHMLYVYAAGDKTTAPPTTAVSDNVGGTWTNIAVEANSGGNGQGSGGAWVCLNAPGGSTTITFSFTGATACFLGVAEYNPNGTTPADASNKAVNTNTTATTVNPGTITTANANDVVLVGANNGNANVTWTAGSGYAVRTSVSSAANMAGALQDQTLSATQAGFATAFGNTSQGWTAIAAAITAASGGGTRIKRNSELNGLGASGPFFNNPLGRTFSRVKDLFLPDRRILVPAVN